MHGHHHRSCIQRKATDQNKVFQLNWINSWTMPEGEGHVQPASPQTLSLKPSSTIPQFPTNKIPSTLSHLWCLSGPTASSNTVNSRLAKSVDICIVELFLCCSSELNQFIHTNSKDGTMQQGWKEEQWKQWKGNYFDRGLLISVK